MIQFNKNKIIKIKAVHESKPEVPESGEGGGWTQRVKGWFSSVRALFQMIFFLNYLPTYPQNLKFINIFNLFCVLVFCF